MHARKFFAELKRRHVYNVTVAYAIGAWLLIQIAAEVFPLFDVPRSTLRLIVQLLVFAGLPIAIILAWGLELTSRGIKRVDHVSPDESISRQVRHELSTLVVVLAVAAAGLLISQRAHPAPGPLAPNSIAVGACLEGFEPPTC